MTSRVGIGPAGPEGPSADAAPGLPPWPFAYQDRLAVLRGQLDGLEALLRPLHEAHRAFVRLGGEAPSPVEQRWVLPAGAVLLVRAGSSLVTDVAEISRGVIPPPDPVTCLASALCNAELWRTAMVEFRSATQWAERQGAEWRLTVPGFD